MTESNSPFLRATIPESATILRMSRAQLYKRIKKGEIATHHDGRRNYIAAIELQRYVAKQAAA